MGEARGRAPVFARILRCVLAGSGESGRNASKPNFLWPILPQMWPFQSKKPDEDTRDRLTLLEKRMARLEEDWTEVYGKFRTMQMRVAKQVQRLDQAADAEAPADTQPVERENGPARGSSLSPRQQELNARILARRSATNLRGGEQQ